MRQSSRSRRAAARGGAAVVFRDRFGPRPPSRRRNPITRPRIGEANQWRESLSVKPINGFSPDGIDFFPSASPDGKLPCFYGCFMGNYGHGYAFRPRLMRAVEDSCGEIYGLRDETSVRFNDWLAGGLGGAADALNIIQRVRSRIYLTSVYIYRSD